MTHRRSRRAAAAHEPLPLEQPREWNFEEVLEGNLRLEVSGQVSVAGPGTVAFLPRRLPHALMVTSPQARYLSFRTPAGFDAFTLAAGTPAVSPRPPVDYQPPDPAEFSRLAAQYGTEIPEPG